MSGNGRRLIAREGIPVLVFLLILATAAHVFLGPVVASLAVGLAVVTAFLCRDPNCKLPSSPLAVLSPASGRVVSVSKMNDDWLARPATRIRIRIAPWDAHCLRSPTEGKVMHQWATADDEREFDREYAYRILTDEGDDLLMVLGMNRAAIFTRMTITSGQRAGQGQRCGYLYFAGTIDVYLPVNSRICVKAGDRLQSGASILGQYRHDSKTSQATDSRGS